MLWTTQHCKLCSNGESPPALQDPELQDDLSREAWLESLKRLCFLQNIGPTTTVSQCVCVFESHAVGMTEAILDLVILSSDFSRHLIPPARTP